MIKLIVSDIDGTLLPDGGHDLNPELLTVIAELRSRGIQFASATGRQWKSIDTIFAPIKEKIFYISDNGAYVGCAARNLELFSIDRDLTMRLIEDIRAEGLGILLSGPDVVYIESDDEEWYHSLVHGYKFHVERVSDLTKVDDAFIKVSIYRSSNVESAVQGLRRKYEDKMKITISGDQWVDCMACGINKGHAVRLLQESLGISPKETMAFGDQMNDVEMLQQAYYSFAVGNARPEVKKAARFQADTNRQDGVLKILKLLL